MGGRYRAYLEYKYTGVEWLGYVPSKWTVIKLKYLISELEAGVSVNAADYPKSDSETGVLKTSCVYTGKFNPIENKTVISEEISRVKCPVRFNSIIISRMNTPDLVGAAAYIDAEYDDLYLPDRLWQTIYFDDSKQCSKYLHYFMCLRGFRDQISGYAEGASSSMQSISKEDYLSISVMLPPLKEQLCIANFLDHETAKIDTLIEKQQQLIKLLKEKRQAVISHAVTKGLNPDAPMRDSGGEWLGEVPGHWIIIPLKLTVSTRKGAAFKSVDFCGSGIRVVKASDIKEKTIRVSEVFLPELFIIDYPKALLNAGDIILSTVGSNPGVKNSAVGQIGMVPGGLEGTLLNQNTVVYDPDEEIVLREFLFYILQMQGYRDHLDLHAHGTANQSSLNIADMLNFKIPLPPINEQIEICNSLQEQQGMLSDLEEKATYSERLLKERRTALISAAVTGKIDVRDWTAPAPQTNKEDAA